MNGKSTLPILDRIGVEDITSNVRIINCCWNSGAKSLGEFLSMGRRRLQLRNYGKKTESLLNDALTEYLENANDRELLPEQINITEFTDSTEETNTLLRILSDTKNPRKAISERRYKHLRSIVENSPHKGERLLSICGIIGHQWPSTPKSDLSSKCVSDYVEDSMSDLFEYRNLGRKRITSIIACMVYLSNEATNQSLQKNTLEETIESLWESSLLQEREREVLQHRFGVNMRKHTLEELGLYFNRTRERIRQIEKDAIRKLRISTDIKTISKMLSDRKIEIWNVLSFGEAKLRKSLNLDTLEDNLPFEIHLAIELCADRRHRNIMNAALGDWLDQNFDHDESNWYIESAGISSNHNHREFKNSVLGSFIESL